MVWWIIPENLIDSTATTSKISTNTSEHDQKISIMWNTIHQTGLITIFFFVLVVTVLAYYIINHKLTILNDNIRIRQMQQTQAEPETLIELLNLQPPPNDELDAITRSNLSTKT
jgi:hypothetical protein